MISVALFLLVILAGALSAWAFFAGGFPVPAGFLLVFAAFWIFGLLRRWKWVSSLGSFMIYMMAAGGLWISLSTLILSLAAYCALLAWDLADVANRLRQASPEDDCSTIQRRHWIRLGLVTFVSALLVGASLLVHVPVTFEWLALLLLFAVWGVGRLLDELLHGRTS